MKILTYDTLESTNKTAKELAAGDDIKDEAVIIANTQTEGAGSRGRSFYSPAGGIYASFIFKPKDIDVKDASGFTYMAAVAVCLAIEKLTGKSPSIKWVNDIYLNDKKIGGILTESSFNVRDNRIDWIVTGIGLNLYIEKEKLPPDIKNRAGGLFESEPKAGTKESLTAELIDIYSEIVRVGDREAVLKEYEKRLLYIGKTVKVFCAGKEYEAVAKGIDHKGRLVVEKPEGHLEVLEAGEISTRLGDDKTRPVQTTINNVSGKYTKTCLYDIKDYKG